MFCFEKRNWRKTDICIVTGASGQVFAEDLLCAKRWGGSGDLQAPDFMMTSCKAQGRPSTLWRRCSLEPVLLLGNSNNPELVPAPWDGVHTCLQWLFTIPSSSLEVLPATLKCLLLLRHGHFMYFLLLLLVVGLCISCVGCVQVCVCVCQ